MQQQSEQKKKQYIHLDKDPAMSILKKWWTELEIDKGARAALRRCKKPVEASFIPAFHDLHGRLRSFGPVHPNIETVAVLAANVRNDTSKESGQTHRFATQMADTGGGTRPLVSDTRFRRLMRIEDQEDLLQTLLRVIHLLDRKVNLPDLANGVYWWNDTTKRDWAYRYYAVSPPSEKTKGE